MLAPHNILRFLARYSEGLRLATEHGPTSGIVFEYAYRNEPQGSGAFGRWIDRTFLQLKAWERVRQRSAMAKAAVAEVVSRRRAAGRSTMILDVSAGTGRYLRELAREQGGDDLQIVCHDRDPREVMLGRQLVAAERVERFTFSVGDPTDQPSYLNSRDPDIVLAVGLFARMPSDDAVRAVMRLAFEHLSPGGCFLCTTPTKSNGWDGNGFGPRLMLRAPYTIAAWLGATGFVDVDQRFNQAHAVGLIGWKPQGPARPGIGR